MIAAGRRYGIWIAAAVAALLIAAGAWLFLDHRREQAEATRGEAYDAAMQRVAKHQFGQAEAALDKVALGGADGYTAMARFALGNIRLARGDKAGAAAKFAQIVNDPKLAQPYRDLALVRQTAAEFDTLKPDAVIQRLGTLANPDSPWFGTAGEMLAAAYLKAGRRAEAAKLYARIGEAGERAPESIRQRARELAKTLSIAPTTAAPAAIQTQEKTAK